MQPLEENFYTFFAGVVDRGAPNAAALSPAKQKLVLTTVQTLLKFVFLVGLTLLVFGQAYAHLALDLYGGECVVLVCLHGFAEGAGTHAHWRLNQKFLQEHC